MHDIFARRLENTLPGRDSFDVEIYGMEGIPKNDLADWKRKRDAELGITPANTVKRPKIFKGVIGIEDLAKQLVVHRQLMKGDIGGGLRVAGAPTPIPGGGPPMPGGPPGVPPFLLPGGIPMPPPGMFPMPPR